MGKEYQESREKMESAGRFSGQTCLLSRELDRRGIRFPYTLSDYRDYAREWRCGGKERTTAAFRRPSLLFQRQRPLRCRSVGNPRLKRAQMIEIVKPDAGVGCPA